MLEATRLQCLSHFDLVLKAGGLLKSGKPKKLESSVSESWMLWRQQSVDALTSRELRVSRQNCPAFSSDSL